MLVAGRSLRVARATAIVLGAASVLAPYAAMRACGMARAAAAAATGVAMVLPWNAWLGVAPVPEAWSGAVGASGMIALGVGSARPWCALAMLVASLCRYEVWPACVVVCFACVVAAARARRSDGPDARAFVTIAREGASAVLAIAGPAAWMAWNAYAHGSATHFVARVTAFRRALGAAAVPLAGKALDYPRALAIGTPEVLALGAIGVAGMCASAKLRRRWAWASAAAAVVFGCLVAGDIQDGAPTHHPERALSLIWWVFAAMGIDAIIEAIRGTPGTARRAAEATLAVGVLAWGTSLSGRLRAIPGDTESERRDAQIAAGFALQSRNAVSIDVTPCAYEHYAVLAAWAAPERATVRPSTHAPVTNACPRIIVESDAKWPEQEP
jgi:hypothetical protein